ncbi:hypothetical protein DERF_010988 [Dermatophagoides farinae]|uniref:Uncharacterized protein n=1 Tax=Dermatophagoides farinae TaxID=6954 RepID=A0A922L2P0_DERFA|nr:hypothetical protein DERF_010988 [Dermatophagoides farinae]
MLVQNNINLASTSTPRPSKQQQPQKTFSEVINNIQQIRRQFIAQSFPFPAMRTQKTQQMLTTRIVPVNEGINIVDSRKLSKGKVAIDFTSPESASSRIEKEQLPNMIKPFNHLISDFITKNNLNIENESTSIRTAKS